MNVEQTRGSAPHSDITLKLYIRFFAFFNVFFKIRKNATFNVFLIRFARFLEHWLWRYINANIIIIVRKTVKVKTCMTEIYGIPYNVARIE